MSIPAYIDIISAKAATKTEGFVKSTAGKLFLALVLVGPITFIPTVITAWTAPDIDALRTSTWTLMTVVNVAGLLGVIHNGDWRMRLVMSVWILMMAAVYVATLVRRTWYDAPPSKRPHEPHSASEESQPHDHVPTWSLLYCSTASSFKMGFKIRASIFAVASPNESFSEFATCNWL